jgi:glycosyltransferase involved in cell wall biosynthesis
MKHLIVSREYPPATYPAGGIGTYVEHIARLMAESGETVHVIAERWNGAPLPRETSYEGRLIIHRIGAGDSVEAYRPSGKRSAKHEIDGLRSTEFPDQWFAWHAALLAEWLIKYDGIDVIEGQEYEAPLYYLLLRRALGMGPERRPPCIVHLHSPAELIVRFNGPRKTWQAYLPMKRMEEFCIRAADALLCPSRYLARQCAARYGLPPERIKVVRLPVGFVSLIERDPDVWARGSVCFVGRLEPRKGIIEWIDAATRVAEEAPDVEFDIVGAGSFGLQCALVSRIPRTLRSRFRFHGPKPRAALSSVLAKARAAVVPSRWENFPNVCIEAMGSGLPVIATRLGGMVELLEDGRTGWLAPDTGVAGMVNGLADALRRCLATSPAELASMGRAAAEAVGELCNNERTVNEQIAFRADVARSGAYRSIALANRPRTRSGPGQEPAATKTDCSGAGVIVRVRAPSDASLTLKSIHAQTVQPRAVAIVYSRAQGPGESVFPNTALDQNTMLLYCPDRTGADAWNAGFEALQSGRKCGFWVFLDGYDILLPDYISQIERVFAHRSELGIISVWTERTIGSRPLEAPLCPEPEYQLRTNEVTPASAFRTEALGEAPPFRRGMPAEYDVYDLANAVMAKGWRAAAYPEILTQRRLKRQEIAWPNSTALRAVRAEVLARFSDIICPETLALVDEHLPIPLASFARDPSDPKSLFRLALFYLEIIILHPGRVARRLVRRVGAVLLLLGAQFGPRGAQTVP